MPTWLKVVLVIVAVGLLGLMAIGFAGYSWMKSNKDRFLEIGKRAKADAARFAATHDGEQCLQEALRRIDQAKGIMAQAELKVFLSLCLDEARESPGMCDGVPPDGEIMRSVAWAADKCTQLGRSGDQRCKGLVTGIQKHCDERGQQPAP
jgi:hypothetical protein